jgi:hypothetical protein
LAGRLNGMMRLTAMLAGGVAAVLVLGGCANGAASPPGGTAFNSAPSNSDPAPSTSPVLSGPATTENQAAAVRDEQMIIAAFRPPSGARRLSGPPAGAGALEADADHPHGSVVEGVQWWSVAGRPSAVVARLAVPTGSDRPGDSEVIESEGKNIYGQEYDWPQVRGVLYSRTLWITGQAIGSTAVLRVDVQVTWVPPRPASSLIPAAVTGVTVGYSRIKIGASKPTAFGPITVTDAGTVGALVNALNSEPMLPDGYSNPCPASFGQMTMTFRAGTSTVATASIEPGGCGLVHVRVTGGSAVTLGEGTTLTKTVISTLRVHWRI